MKKRTRSLKVLVMSAAFAALMAAPAQAGPVGETLCDMGSSPCTIYTIVDRPLCMFSADTCHL